MFIPLNSPRINESNYVFGSAVYLNKLRCDPELVLIDFLTDEFRLECENEMQEAFCSTT